MTTLFVFAVLSLLAYALLHEPAPPSAPHHAPAKAAAPAAPPVYLCDDCGRGDTKTFKDPCGHRRCRRENHYCDLR